MVINVDNVFLQHCHQLWLNCLNSEVNLASMSTIGQSVWKSAEPKHTSLVLSCNENLCH